jgi:hypothetical protein
LLDPRTGTVKAVVGSFRGDLIFNGPAGNGIALGDLSLTPPIQQVHFGFPKIRMPVFTVLTRPVPLAQQPPPMIPPAIPPPLEFVADTVQRRYLEVRIVVPIDDAASVREQAVMQLPAEMLTDLPALLRRLPDDRYRIYLMLEGSAEERLVIDVLVRDGRPIEAAESIGEVALPDPAAPTMPPPADLPVLQPDAAQPQELQEFPLPALGPTGSLPDPQSASPHSGRLFAGLGVAAAAIVAGRSTGRWTEQVDRAAERIGSGQAPRGRWWRGLARHFH